MSARRIGGHLIVAMRPSQALPPFRIERAPRDATERKQLRERCLQIVYRLQGALLAWKDVQLRAETMLNDAIAEASRKVREPASQPRVIQPPQEKDETRTPGGIIIPKGA